jgi:hypothetical protein
MLYIQGSVAMKPKNGGDLDLGRVGECHGVRSKTTARILNDSVEISNMNWRRLITCCWVNAGG